MLKQNNTKKKLNALQADIPNKCIEKWFLRICNNDQIQIYYKFIDEKQIALATAYATNVVDKKFMTLVEKNEADELARTYWSREDLLK